jgi:putative ABC transport system permease protein
MLKNFFTIAWRNLWKNKAYAGINILGLSLGIGCGILIFALVSYHLSFDNFHPDKDRIYRIVTEFREIADYSQGVPTPLGKAFRNDFDYAEKVARVIGMNDDLITIQDGPAVKKFKEEKGVAYTEPEYFNIFNFPLLQGDKASVLRHPGEALITERLARKYFGDASAAMGKTIRVDNKTDFAIVGILRDIPVNTDRNQEIYLSYTDIRDQRAQLASDSSWGSVYSQSMCFLRLRPGVTAAQANDGLLRIGKKYNKGRDVQTTIYRLQPLADIHFNADFDGVADKKYLWSLFFIGVFILITACVNFINLATAQALNRSTEVGIRKVLGGLRRQLFWQFIMETAFIAVFAALVGCLLAMAALPAVNNIFKSEISLHLSSDPAGIAFILTLLVVVIFLAGSYPGLVLSQFKPVAALKSKLSQKEVGGFSLRRILVVTQFAISQMLIIGTIVIAGQLRYAGKLDLGFDRTATVLLRLPQNEPARLNTMRARIASIAGIRDVSLCRYAPASDANNTTNLRFAHRAEDEHFEVNTKPADDQYLRTFGLKLVAGRNFFPTADSAREAVVNETMVRRLNLEAPAAILGQTIKINRRLATVVGVVRDFNNYSLHTEIAPIIIYPAKNEYGTCAVKLDPAHVHGDLAALEKIWNETFPQYLYSYTFFDDSIAKFYELDNSLLSLIEFFAAIAVFIGCLGLYGLTSFMAVRKTKEIGVRKVLGAGVPGILWLFGREFSRLLLIAFVVAAPAAWWIMQQYLRDFKYRITVGPAIFLLALGVTAVIVVLTVGWRSLRSALANPVTALRSE